MQDEPLEPPGSIAILGAGPIGLEAALYARSLGYTVKVFEAGEVGETFRHDASALLPEPFGRCRSPLAMAALSTQNPQYQAPHPDFPINYRDYREHYLLPLAASDLLSDNVVTHTRVISIELEPFDSPDEDGELPPADFVLTLETNGETITESFECLIDCTGAHKTSEVPYPAAVYDPASAAHPDLATGIPYLYRLGAKSQRDAGYLSGLEQIRRLFAMLNERPQLDLYRTARF